MASVVVVTEGGPLALVAGDDEEALVGITGGSAGRDNSDSNKRGELEMLDSLALSRHRGWL